MSTHSMGSKKAMTPEEMESTALIMGLAKEAGCLGAVKDILAAQHKVADIDKAAGDLLPKLDKSVDNVLERFITQDPYVKTTVFPVVRLVSKMRMSVLILGETGTGKEIIAQALAEGQPGKYVPVNCTAMPEQLFETELFGHVKGAFTGADRTNKGLVQLAENGTLFFDEIGDMPMSLQGKLLRFLEEREYRAVGDDVYKKATCRCIFATCKDVHSTLRPDLLARISEVTIGLPRILDRLDDVPLLIEHFYWKFIRENGLVYATLPPRPSAEFIDDLSGNVRSVKEYVNNYLLTEYINENREFYIK